MYYKKLDGSKVNVSDKFLGLTSGICYQRRRERGLILCLTMMESFGKISLLRLFGWMRKLYI